MMYAIGDKVRILRGNIYPHRVGDEGVIDSLDLNCDGNPTDLYPYRVLVDGAAEYYGHFELELIKSAPTESDQVVDLLKEIINLLIEIRDEQRAR